MTEPNAELLDGRTPTIPLAGKEWPVPLLAPRQNRIVVPLIMRHAASLSALIKGGKISLESLAKLLTTEVYDALAEVSYCALTRAHKISRDEFNDMPIETMDLIMAFFVVATQTGLIRPAKPGEQVLGEEMAATQSTGTP
jgi:hypothetical protein